MRNTHYEIYMVVPHKIHSFVNFLVLLACQQYFPPERHAHDQRAPTFTRSQFTSVGGIFAFSGEFAT